MPRNASRDSEKLSLAAIATKQPEVGKRFAAVTLGGVCLYGPDHEFLDLAIGRIQMAIETGLDDSLLSARNQVEKAAREALSEPVSERVLGAVLGKSLRLGVASMLPCLTI